MRYAELHPQDLARAFTDGAPAILPIGALEWHGPHLPLGVDLFVAEAFSARLRTRLGGVLLPALITPVTTLPHPMSLQVATEGFRVVIDDTLNGLIRAGAKKLLVVTGHYTEGHEIELYEAAMRVMDDHPKVSVFAASPLEPIGNDALLDHAGRVQTSLMMSIRPDLVRLEALTDHEPAVMGEDPRTATVAVGESMLAQGLDAWCNWVDSGRAELRRWYGVRFDAHDCYVEDYYRGSWEDAMVAWWADQRVR